MGKIKRKMSDATELPQASFGACPYFEIEGNHSIKIDECLEILSYDEEKTVLKLKGLTVSVIGKGLTMNSYGMGTIRLVGRIDNLVLEENGRGDKRLC